MAQRLGMITDKRHQKLYYEADTLKEQAMEERLKSPSQAGENK